MYYPKGSVVKPSLIISENGSPSPNLDDSSLKQEAAQPPNKTKCATGSAAKSKDRAHKVAKQDSSTVKYIFEDDKSSHLSKLNA